MYPRSLNQFVPFSCLLVFCAFILLIASSLNVQANSKVQVEYSGENISIQSEDVQLLPLLEAISKETGVAVFVAEKVESRSIDLRVQEENLKSAFKRVLRNYNHVMIFSNKGNGPSLVKVQIYPQGSVTGQLQAMGGGNATREVEQDQNQKVIVSSGDSEVEHRFSLNGGKLLPMRDNQNVVKSDNAVKEPWYVLKKELQAREREMAAELRYKNMQTQATKDPVKKKARSRAQGENLQDFYQKKKEHINKIEAMKRIQEFQKLSGNN